MRAEQLAAYFSKKIAKPITFGVPVQTSTRSVFWVYQLDVTAVEAEYVYVLVTLKGTREEGGRWLEKK